MPLTADDRKAELKRRRVNIEAFARSLGVDGSHVHHVLAGRSRSPRIEQAIADKLELPVSDVFPPNQAGTAVGERDEAEHQTPDD